MDFGKDKPSGPVRNSGGGYLGRRMVFGGFGVWKVSVRSLVAERLQLGLNLWEKDETLRTARSYHFKPLFW